MNYVDIIILVCVVALISVILYFNIRNFKNNNNGCTNCPYAKSCTKKTEHEKETCNIVEKENKKQNKKDLK